MSGVGEGGGGGGGAQWRGGGEWVRGRNGICTVWVHLMEICGVHARAELGYCLPFCACGTS